MFNDDFVMAGWLFKKFSAMENAATLGISRSKYQSTDTGKGDGGCAHGAGFQRYIQIMLRDSLGVYLFATIADGHDFGVSGGVGQRNC